MYLMDTTTDLSALTPVEIDTLLADAWQRVYALDMTASLKERYANDYDKYDGYADKAAALREEAVALEVEASKIHSNEIAPLNREFTRRGGWHRAFLVVNNGTGHVHSSMACSTCRITTQFHWMVEYSAKSQEEIIEAAGERACTVCYPDAPVGVKGTKMFTPAEIEKQHDREEREAKRAAKVAAQVHVLNYQGYGGRIETKVFKTVRAVTNEIASMVNSAMWYGETHPSFPEWQHNITAMIEALKLRGESYDFEAVKEKQRKKVRREGGTPKF
jgi:hypothetical protein